MSLAILQGCDGLNDVDSSEHTSFSQKEAAPVSDTHSKLRHPNQLSNASRTVMDRAGKLTTNTTDLFIAFNTYEADGITPRLINKFDLTNRILNEYGITRRVLNQYGITHRILNEFGITRRVLNQYGITKRVMSKYGLTPRVLKSYGDQITDTALIEFGITDEKLAAEGLTRTDLTDFNTLSEVLNDNGISIEQYFLAIDAYQPDVRFKVHLDGTQIGISTSVTESVVNDFLDEISTDKDILFVEPDITFSVSDLGTTSGSKYDKQITPWNITSINTPIPGILGVFREDYVKTNPVHVYLLDSGASQDSWLDDVYYVEKKDFTMLFENPGQLTWEEDDAPDVSGFDPDTLGNPYDESGHGSHIAGTIGAHNNLHGVVGIAPSVRIHSLKVLNAQGQTDITTLMAAVDYVTRAKRANPDWPIVVNMSLGVDIGTTAYNILDEAIEASIAEGVIYVAAAGNEGRNADTYSPAHVQDVITVGSYDENQAFSYFSNHGASVDLLAPGENIISLSHLKDETRSFQSILMSGTSHAAPHVTGAVARYLGEKPLATAGEVQEALIKASSESVVNTPSGTTALALDIRNLLGTDVEKQTDDSNDTSYYNWWSSGDKDYDYHNRYSRDD